MEPIPSSWKRLFIFDLRSLACFRICLALILLADLFIRSWDLTAHYTDLGIFPRSFALELNPSSGQFFFLYFLSGSTWFIGCLFAVSALVAILLLLGYRTTLMTFLSWFLLICLHQRNHSVLFGGDALLRIILFWGIFLPLGEKWSIDEKTKTQSNSFWSVATIAYLFQVCIIYWASVGYKWNEDWLSGNAVAFALNIDIFATDWGVWLREYSSILPLFTYGTLFLELFGPFLLFIPWKFGLIRTATVILFVLMHLSFGLFLTIGLFPYICITAWIPFLPSEFWDKLFQTTARIVPVQRVSNLENGIIGIIFTYAVLLNIHVAFPSWHPPILPKTWVTWFQGFHLKQHWNMFSKPLRDDGWYVLEATLQNGEKVDLLKDGKPVDWSKPSLISDQYKTQRWRKFYNNIWWKKNDPYREPYLLYMVNQWNQSHSGLETIKEVRLFFILEKTNEDLTIQPPQKVFLKSYTVGESDKTFSSMEQKAFSE